LIDIFRLNFGISNEIDLKNIKIIKNSARKLAKNFKFKNADAKKISNFFKLDFSFFLKKTYLKHLKI